MKSAESFLKLTVACAAAAAFSGSPPALAAPYSIGGDFSVAANPNGVWSYGWLDRLGGTFTLYNLPSSHTSATGAILDAWQHSTVQALGAPSAVNNPTGLSFESGTVIIPGGWAAFHPGEQGQLSSFRFTAPSAGNYRIDLDFQGADCCTTSTDVHVWTAGADLFSALIDGNGEATRKSFARSVPLAAGQTVDVAVGFGSNGNFYFDSTAVRGTIDALPPAPPSLLPNDFRNTWRSAHQGFRGEVRRVWTLQETDESGQLHTPEFYDPAVAPDGTVYAHRAFDDTRLYAVSPGGQVLWRYDTRGDFVPLGRPAPGIPAVGPDGTIYVMGMDGRLHAIHADGTRKWVSSVQPQLLDTGPKVRVLPTGRILVSSLLGIDVFDLEGQRVSFLDYFRLLDPSYTPGLSGFTGWIIGDPAVSPDGRTYYIHAGVRPLGQQPFHFKGVVEARSVENHELLWSADGFDELSSLPFPGTNGHVRLSTAVMVDDAGNIYAYGCASQDANGEFSDCALRSLDPSGTERWRTTTGSETMVNLLGLTPDNTGLALRCGQGIGERGFPGVCTADQLDYVNMLDTRTGAKLWSNTGPRYLPGSRLSAAAFDSEGVLYVRWSGPGGAGGFLPVGPDTSERWNELGAHLPGASVWDPLALGPKRRLYLSAGGLIAYDQVGFVGNTAPVANAGPDKQVVVGMSVTLDGSASSDADGDPLTFRWAIDSGPFLGVQQLTDANQAVATFAPAQPGDYTLSLVVNDGTENSAPDTANVTAITPLQCMTDAANAAIAAINGAPAADIDAIGHREALVNFVEQGRAAALVPNRDVALARFGDALRRTDGCALRGTPDAGGAAQDWLIGCTTAATAYTHIRRAIDCAALLVP